MINGHLLSPADLTKESALNLLSTAKNLLKDQAIELYDLYAEDIPLKKEEYRRHYANLGETLFEIDSIKLFSELIAKLESNFFSELGYHSDDEDLLEEFLEAVKRSQ